MYFKQRERSPLCKLYHHKEIKRLENKLNQIKTRKKRPQKQNNLPTITNKEFVSPHRKKQVELQNLRLSSQIAKLKESSSDYFKSLLNDNGKAKALSIREKNKQQNEKIKKIYTANSPRVILKQSKQQTSRKNTDRKTSQKINILSQR